MPSDSRLWKESITPKTVGAILQQITDLQATASTEAERKVLDNWKAMLPPMVFVYDLEHNTNNMRGDLEHLFLTMRGARYMPFGKVRVYVDVLDTETDELRYRKTRLKYGIAFVRETPEYNRGRVDIAKLATPIVPFYISTVTRNGQFSIIFEK